MKAQKITIRLLKPGKSPQDVLKDSYAQKETSDKIPAGAELYSSSFYNPNPDWAKYIGVKSKTQGARAVLFIRINRPKNEIGVFWFAICFAGGHHMLNLDDCIEDFGIKSGLNMLDPDGIKSSDVFMPSERSKQRRIQTTQNANLQEHDFDGYLNILKNATGNVKSEYQSIAKGLSFSYDALTFHTKQTAAELPKILLQLASIYESYSYKKLFPEVDYIKPVRDKILLGMLDSNLSAGFSQQSDNIYLNIPDIIDFSDVSKYGYDITPKKRGIARESYISAAICDIYHEISAFKDAVPSEFLKKKYLILYDDNDAEIKQYPLYKCLVYDCSYKDTLYHFSHGQWYSLDDVFAKKLKEKTEKAIGTPPPPFTLLPYYDDIHNDEADYNQKLAEKNSAVLLDRKLIAMGGRDKIEPCDVLYKSVGGCLYFIHVKHKHGGSSGMAHLFAQGDNSLTLLRNQNQKFLQGLCNKIGNITLEALINLITSSKIYVVYLIIAEKDKKEPVLPLFSKISLVRAIDSLRSKNAFALWNFVEHFESNDNQNISSEASLLPAIKNNLLQSKLL